MIYSYRIGVALGLAVSLFAPNVGNAFDQSCMDRIVDIANVFCKEKGERVGLPGCPPSLTCHSFRHDTGMSFVCQASCGNPINPAPFPNHYCDGVLEGTCNDIRSDFTPGSYGGAPGGSPSTEQACRKGSIIQTDSQNLGESVPLVGTPMSLSYFTDRVVGRGADYTTHIPLPAIAAQKRISTVVAGVTTSQITTNSSFDFRWSGRDSGSNWVPGATQLEVAIEDGATEPFSPIDCETTSPGQSTCVYSLSDTSSASSVQIPYRYSHIVGGYKAIVAGLGGWTLSEHHFYDALKGMLYFGDGTSRSAKAHLINNGTQYMTASEDGSLVFIFDLSGKHLETKNGLTGVTLSAFAYDQEGRLSSITDAYSNQTKVERDFDGRLIGIRAPYGQLTELTLDADGFLSSIRNPKGETYLMTYYEGGLLQSFMKPKGQVSTFAYDSNGLLIEDLSSSGTRSTLSILSQDPINGTRSTEIQSALGRAERISVAQSPTKMSREEVDSRGITRTTSSTYNSSLLIQKGAEKYEEGYLSDPRLGKIANYTSSRALTIPGIYSYEQNFKSVTPQFPPSPYEYTTLQTWITKLGTKTTSIVFTRETGLTEIISPVGRKLSVVSDPLGKVRSQRLASFAPTRFVYDERGRLTRVIQGQRSSEIFYNADGFIRAIRNPLDQVTRLSYDLAGRVRAQMLPDSRVIRYRWDKNGNLLGVTPPEKPEHLIRWNLMDLLMSYLPPAIGGSAIGAMSYSYNADEQLTRIQKADGSLIEFQYHLTKGELERVLTPDGDFSLTHTLGKLTSLRSPEGITHAFSYSGPLLLQDSLSGPSGESLGSMRFSYNNDLLLKSSLATASDGLSVQPIDFLYDDDGLLTQAGNVKYRRVVRSGLLNRVAPGRVSEELAYDPTYGELQSVLSSHISADSIISPLLSQTLLRDPLGRITQKTESILGGPTQALGYSYDSLGRLTDVTKDGVPQSHYQYDANGNRISGMIRGTPLLAVYDEQDRLVLYNSVGFSYNSNGELLSKVDSQSGQTTTYSFDSRGALKSVTLPSKSIHYRSDALGRRQARFLNGSLHSQYLYEDGIRIGAILNNQGAITHRFIYGSKQNVPDAAIIQGRQYRLLSDSNGSVRLVIHSASGAIAQRLEYDEFGVVLSDSNPGFQPFGFSGGLYDPDTKLVHFGARDYDAEVGRWISKDPILFSGGDTNLYGYVSNDPVNWIDREGTIKKLPHEGGGGAGIPNQAGPSAWASITERIARKPFSPDQRALIDLAKQANNRGGMSMQEAKTMVEWANEFGIRGRIDPAHPGTQMISPHLHLGPVQHVPICK